MTNPDDLKAAHAELEESRRHLDQGEQAKALACCARALERLDGDGPELLHARLAPLRTSADPEGIPEVERLSWAGDVLAGAGSWEEAMGAYFLLSREAAMRQDASAERRWLARALGCADAAGSKVIAPNLLRRLALVELRDGDPKRAGELATLAFERLSGVLLLCARLSEAECRETMGDAWAAMGDRAQAEFCWRDALARQESLERRQAAESLRAKLEGKVP